MHFLLQQAFSYLTWPKELVLACTCLAVCLQKLDIWPVHVLILCINGMLQKAELVSFSDDLYESGIAHDHEVQAKSDF